jgi:hypothetical protein
MIPVLDSYSCSSIAAWGLATEDHHMYMTRDLDWSLEAKAHNFPCVVVYIPEEGVPHVNVTFAGMVGSHTGINLAGIAVAEMGDSPDREYPYNLDGMPFFTLFRNILYDAHRLGDALDIVKNAKRIKRYHYVMADGRWENAAVKMKAHAPEAPPNDLVIWRDNDPTDEVAPNVARNVVYNDEGRGAWPGIVANYGHLTANSMIDLANSIPIVGGNVVNVVYDATTLDFYVAYAQDTATGTVEAYKRPYVHVRMNDYLP